MREAREAREVREEVGLVGVGKLKRSVIGDEVPPSWLNERLCGVGGGEVGRQEVAVVLLGRCYFCRFNSFFYSRR